MTAWYEQSFGKDYLTVYKHRDMQRAISEVRKMIGWLALEPGAAVLDLCCGMGRHSLALAEAGFTVTGMDLSVELLREAGRHDDYGRVRWVQGDMREVPLEGKFDAVVNLFTSFGYFADDRENARVVAEIQRLLKDRGNYIIDFLNADHVAKHLVSFSRRQAGALIIEEARTIEDGFVRKNIVIREQGRPERQYKEQVKLYRLADFRKLTAAAGLTIDHIYGNADGEPYREADSPRLILVGTKKGAYSS